MAPLPFKTPTNQQSFSGLVDAAVMATGKPASLISIIQYANNVVRECQALGLFADDLVDDALVVPSTQPLDTVFTWTKPYLFRSLRTIKYLPANGLTTDIYPDLALPGKNQKGKFWLYYAVSNYFVFKGVGANDTVATATYYWLAPLGYYAVPGVNTAIFPGGPYDNRLAYFDTGLGIWQYLQADGVTYGATTGSPITDAQYQALSANWMTQAWYDLILSGTKCKLWTSAGDPRAGAEYSNYKQQQKLLQNTHGYESEGF